MEDFYLKKTTKTPSISIEMQTGKFVISGRSIPENSIEFYKPLYEWLDTHAKVFPQKVSVEIRLEYFNTSSSKCLVGVFRRLEKIRERGKIIEVTWFYDEEDEDMLESGEDFSQIINLPITIKPE